MRVYDRFWSNAEIRSGGTLVQDLRRQITLFHFASGPVEAVAHGGVLSLKGVTAGRVAYGIGRRRFETTPDRVLLVPEDAHHATRIGPAGATILSLYFPAALAAEAQARAVHGDAALLERPEGAGQLAFPPHLRRMSAHLRTRFASVARAHSAEQLQGAGFDLLDAFVAASLEASRQWVRAPAAKPAVRAELFRRASVARDLIEDNLHRAPPLDELAAAACLSPFHLHRVFAGVFGETPFEMSRRRRLETAKGMLAGGSSSIETIAAAVGFENAPAFSRAFRAACGVSPSAWRRAALG